MCVSAQLQIEFEAEQRWHNRRLMEDIRNRVPIFSASCFDRPAWPVVTAQEPDVLQLMSWCYLPPHVQGDPMKFITAYSTYNVRNETLYSSKLYGGAMEAGLRCLIPITGFYEHRHWGKLKVPYLIQPNSSDAWWLAGLYQPESRTFAIITTEANEVMAQIHNQAKRQPVILPGGYQEAFLHEAFTQEQFTEFCVPLPHQVMRWKTVSKLLTQRGVDRNVPAVSEEFIYEGLPPLEVAA